MGDAAFSELLAHPEVREQLVLGSPVGFLALHGGLEPGTAEIAAEAAARAGASCYAVVQPDHLKRHVPSTEIAPSHSETLARFVAHVSVIVSLHGYWGHGPEPVVYVGGAARRRAGALASLLRDALPGYAIVDDLDAIPRRLRGTSARNPVNALPGGGVQLELPHPVRAVGPYGHGEHAERYHGERELLVAALTEFARGAAGDD
jgi:phage replication-related protein YjqB (UPF0714/DUF867 family)